MKQATSTIEAQGQGSSRPRVASNQVAPTPGPHSAAHQSKAQTRTATPKTAPSASPGTLKFLKLQFQPSGKEAFTLHAIHDPVDNDPARATSFILREAWQVLAKESVSESGFKKQSAKIIKVEGFATATTTPEQFALCNATCGNTQNIPTAIAYIAWFAWSRFPTLMMRQTTLWHLAVVIINAPLFILAMINYHVPCDLIAWDH